MQERDMVGMQAEDFVKHRSGAISTPEQGGAPAADAPEAADGEVVSAAELLRGGADGDEEGLEDFRGEAESPEPTVLEEQADAADEPARTYTKKEFDTAVRRKIELASRDMKGKLEADPFYRLGRRIAEGEAMKQSIDPQAAVQTMLQGGGALQQAAAGISTAVKQAAANIPLQGEAKALTDNPAVARLGQEIFQSMLNGDIPQNARLADYAKV